MTQFTDKSQYLFIDCTILDPKKIICLPKLLIEHSFAVQINFFQRLAFGGDWGIEARLEFKRWTKEKRGYFLEKGGRVPESESYVRGRHKKRRVVDIHEEGRKE